MLHDASTPQQYLSNLPDDWRKYTLMQLRALVLRQGPDLEESVHYKMLGYGAQDRFVFHLNAQKGYVSLYVGDIHKIDPTGEPVSGLDVGKGCIRFKKTTSIPETSIDALIDRAVARWREGHDDGC